MKILKFGGNSLENGKGIENVISILQNKLKNREEIYIVLSARGNTTDQLKFFLEEAKNGNYYADEWKKFKAYQLEPLANINFKKEFKLLEDIFQGVRLTKDYSSKVKDLVLAQGEILATQLVAEILSTKGFKSSAVDSRLFLETDSTYGNAIINDTISEQKTINFFNSFDKKSTPIITGFISSNKQNETTTLGRNGSNYSASLIANYLNAEEVQSYTHINGIYTANPTLVSNARIIEQINYTEANELASFGASILHAKTIAPLLEKKIPLRILNTFNRNNKGTLINNNGTKKGIKSISIQEEIGLINIEGKGLLGKKGTDARIFTSLSNHNISIGIISQGSSERGVSFVVPKKQLSLAKEVLLNEFKYEILIKDIHSIESLKDVSVVTVVGQNISKFSPSLDYLNQNKVSILLINNTISGNNISLVLQNKDVKKSVNIIHSQIFGINKNINIAIFGKGTVGSSLINQILESRDKILDKKETNLNIFAIIGSQKVLFNKDGITKNWKNDYDNSEESTNSIKEVIQYAKKHHLENLIAIDNTASSVFVNNYIPLLESSFDLISSNKIANTQDYSKYRELRKSIKNNNKQYLYETNVGAGLPIIDTIRILHESGENITRIRGVFSGSLSYLFNQFSSSDKPFSYFLQNAIKLGYTEPDPREDLCGNDVACKLLILARELALENEFDEIEIENLIPEDLRNGDPQTFFNKIDKINPYYQSIKDNLKKNHVLRYIGDLSGNLQESKGDLTVKLVSIPSDSALGGLKGSDSIFEIYTDSYGENPITIIGAGAGAEVTARGVLGDLLRIADKK
ncbi:MAG: aspartate kinase [Bacteroidetes bacterium]|nr:aspartate kinase [Bacteroidota bacterium]